MKILFALSFWLTINLVYGQQSQVNIDIISSNIESIRVKKDWVKSIPEEDSIAVNQGWYEKMDLQLNKLFDQKRNLIMNETGKRWVSKEEFESLTDKKKQVLSNDENFIIEHF